MRTVGDERFPQAGLMLVGEELSPRAKQSGTRFGRPPIDPSVIAEILDIARDARAKGCTAEEAAQLVG